MTRGTRTLLGVVVVALLCVVAWRSMRGVARELSITQACEAGAHGNTAAALDQTEALVDNDDAGLTMLECRCFAQLKSGNGVACTDALERELPLAPKDWLPDALLVRTLVDAWSSRGENERAVELLQRAHARDPDDDAFSIGLVQTRMLTEPAPVVFDDVEKQLTPTSWALRVALAYAALDSDPARSLRVLGDAPPPDTSPHLRSWINGRCFAAGHLGRIEVMSQTHDLALAHGMAKPMADVLLAQCLSHTWAVIPGVHVEDLLKDAITHSEVLDPGLRKYAHARLLQVYATDHRTDAALELLNIARGHGVVLDETEDDIRHQMEAPVVDNKGEQGPPRGDVTFTFPSDFAGHLVVSRANDAPVDAPWDVFIVDGRPLRMARALGVFAQRWVLLDAHDAVRGSGTFWPQSGTPVVVDVKVRDAPVTTSNASLPLLHAHGDGKHRVFVVLLDSGDWQIVQYLRARHELPVIDALVQHGRHAVLTSQPPSTAVAMAAMTQPQTTPRVTLLRSLVLLGDQLAVASSIHENPLAVLDSVLPTSPSLFQTLGADDKVAVNFTFGTAGIHSGTNRERIGPHGAVGELHVEHERRDLTADERARFPLLAQVPSTVHTSRDEMLAQFDTIVGVAHDPSVDFFFTRIDHTDITTHNTFLPLSRGGQDDGAHYLLEVYRYCDARIGEVASALDDDDVLVVMSDHGTRTAMDHDPATVFVASGGGLVPGRIAGAPSITGIPRVFADLLGVSTTWPATGIDVVTPVATHETH
jgi:hypothetical protein